MYRNEHGRKCVTSARGNSAVVFLHTCSIFTWRFVHGSTRLVMQLTSRQLRPYNVSFTRLSQRDSTVSHLHNNLSHVSTLWRLSVLFLSFHIIFLTQLYEFHTAQFFESFFTKFMESEKFSNKDCKEF